MSFNSIRYIAYRTNDANLFNRPCGMNDVVYMDNKLPTSKNISLMNERAKIADYDFVVLFDNDKHYSTYGAR